MKTKLVCRSVLQAALVGAVLGFAAALAYGSLFALYGILRVSLRILVSPANGLGTTLAANTVAVFIGSIFFAIVFGIIAALVQALTLALIYGLSRAINPDHSPRRGALIGLATSTLLILVLQLVFRAGPGILTQIFGQQSYLFWFGLPTLIYVGLATWLGWKMRFGPEGRSWPAHKTGNLTHTS